MIQNANTASKRQAITPLEGGHYNWIGQPERLVYMGTRRYPGSQVLWHQFAKVEAPEVCWSEVLTSELAMFEETKGSQMTTTPTSGSSVLPEARLFTKKPVTIAAIQWTGKNLREVIAFTDGPPDTRTTHAGMAWEAYTDLVARDGLKIYTLEGKMLASPGDWIIRGVKGEYYPCKPDIFEATYSPAALAAGQATAPQAVDYAVLPEKYYLARGEVPTWDAKRMHAFADATHTLRASPWSSTCYSKRRH